MKNNIKCIFAWILAMCLLVSCGSTTNEQGNDIHEAEPQYKRYSFNSYQELANWLVADESGKSPAIANYEDYADERDRYGNGYKELIDRMASGEIQLKIPAFNNFDTDGGNTLFTGLSFGRPWIWYDLFANERLYFVEISYLSEDEMTKAQGKSLKDVMELIPEWDFESFNHNKNEPLQELTLKLADKSVSALCAKNTSTGFYTYYWFIYEDMLIMIRDFEREITIDNDFWENLSFKIYEETDNIVSNDQ